MLHECYIRIINLAQWHLKKLAEGLVLKSEKVKEGRGTKNGWITSADVARLSLQEIFHGQSKHPSGCACTMLQRKSGYVVFKDTFYTKCAELCEHGKDSFVTF